MQLSPMTRCSRTISLLLISSSLIRPDISDLEKQLSDQSNRLLNLQEMVDDLASKLNGQTTNLSLKGSPYWMAPESVIRIDASSDIALAVDIWSLGCTIIEMMNGKLPWSEYAGAAALFRALIKSPSIPNAMSVEGQDYLQCLFRRNPAGRPTTSKLLDHPFVNCSRRPHACTQSLKEMKFKKKHGMSCWACKAVGFYACKLCKGNGTIKWSPLYDPVFINPCVCPTCDGFKVQRCLNCLGSGSV